ncbi:MAG: alpha/beta hydrolase [Paracoccus sp. (in: a-proteobacteria)]|uniref:alpha/beta hydrolase n=1 Tax=unclassified Paracoccus (in: a-proteobacteria) TaxID=2688777 RepID=UPI000C6164A4|nr:alpha/beta hydrolase [Paracoccus sp. UBA5162]MAN55741.1 alpha/beta hydrolase [Paracoccus sp. (in: a-proteobacteria)]HIC65108.1 alpha/beta fold hydrolase [Paracoccus sp. (in: a-proteobacteria)]
MLYRITDWDDAYANARHIPDGEAWPARWAEAAAAFRQRHMPQPLGQGHLFRPDGDVQGLVVFVHGGYWMRFDPSLWSHLAAGPLAHGWAVALPAYTLAPAARIPGITQEVARTIAQAAAAIAGPIALTGHSAGGHLAARMICDDGTLPAPLAARVSACVPISGLFDLRPLMRTRLNDTLRLDPAEAAAESPALLTPRADIPVTAWVGGAERPEFLRQARLLADIWAGLGAATQCVIAPGRHHFDVMESLACPDSAMTRALLSR